MSKEGLPEEILDYRDGRVIYEVGDHATLVEAVEAAVAKGISLAYAYLCHAKLQGARLAFADLRGARLASAVLKNADLSNADLSNAQLMEADLRGALRDGWKIAGADFRAARL